MAKIMKATAWLATLLAILCAGLYRSTQTGLFLSLAITFGTTSYHFLMRLLTGWIINRIFHNRVDYRASWFQLRAWEEKLYKALRVKSWKNKMPTYAPDCFDPKLHSWEEIAQAMCQSELVHEVIVVLSFAPLLGAIPFGAFRVFLITSLLAAGFDSMFVCMQRYNRPRVLKLTHHCE